MRRAGRGWDLSFFLAVRKSRPYLLGKVVVLSENDLRTRS